MRCERRKFLANVGSGMLIASVGSTLAVELGLTAELGDDQNSALNFGRLEPLVQLMQQTPVESLQGELVDRLRQGVALEELVAAGALANARTFGGQDYDGYHTFMALAPALEMSRQLPLAEQALPILKVLYRNTARIQACGGRESEVLHAIHEVASSGALPQGEALQAASRNADMDTAEKIFAAMMHGPANEAYNHLQFALQDEVDVHRTVLTWRAWKMTELVGQEHAHTLLRQSVRYCVDAEQSMQSKNRNRSGIRELLPKLLDELELGSRKPGSHRASDAELLELSRIVFEGSRDQAAQAVTAAMADGLSIESVGEALSLAANHLLLFDAGRTAKQASADKPQGSVHGASVGVHACDSANAWRNIANVSNIRNQFASMIVGAYHTAGQRGGVAAEELPYAQTVNQLDLNNDQLLMELDAAIKSKDQLLACALTYRYLKSGGEPTGAFKTLLRFAVSEEGALHAEKFYRTVQEEYATTRPTFRWRHLVALARVSASEYGFPAAGLEQARELLRIG